MLIDSVRARDLLNKMGKVGLRMIRATFEELTKDDTPFRVALRNLNRIYTMLPQKSFNKWKAQVANKNSVTTLKSRLQRGAKLKAAIERPAKRALKSARTRATVPKGVANRIRTIGKALMAAPKDALRKWNNAVQAIKQGKILDNVRAHKLQACLAKVPNRKMKDAQFA